MRRYVFPAIVLSIFFLAGRFWSEKWGHAKSGDGIATENGDVNGDGKRDISDAVRLLSWLFLGEDPPVAIGDGCCLTAEQAEILSYMEMVTPIEMEGKKTLKISGVNVQIVNGGSGTGTANGTGNLIVGYQERRTGINKRSGSHNVIIGTGHDYDHCGGLVVGRENSILADYASVSGGRWNRAEGDFSSVTGGGGYDTSLGNIAVKEYAAVSGGTANRACGVASSVSGGFVNLVGNPGGPDNGRWACISGGSNNTATGEASSITGGHFNQAVGELSSVTGGGGSVAEFGNRAIGPYSTVTGGTNNEANGEASTVLAGRTNIAHGNASAIAGGAWNQANERHSSVSGGENVTIATTGVTGAGILEIHP
jgi:hypothetical protein